MAKTAVVTRQMDIGTGGAEVVHARGQTRGANTVVERNLLRSRAGGVTTEPAGAAAIRPEKRVILSMGGKGGVGKTSVMAGLAEWFVMPRGDSDDDPGATAIASPFRKCPPRFVWNWVARMLPPNLG